MYKGSFTTGLDTGIRVPSVMPITLEMLSITVDWAAGFLQEFGGKSGCSS